MATAHRHNKRNANPVSACYRRILRNMLPLLVFYLACQLIDGDETFYRVVNGSAPVYLILALLLPAYRLVRVSAESLWTPAVWLPISSAVFYGFGPLVAVYGNEQTLVDLSHTRLTATQVGVHRANVLSAVGIFGLMAGFWFHTQFRREKWRFSEMEASSSVLVRPLYIALLFIAVGGALKYLILKPAEWGMVSLTVPGVVSTMSPLVDVGYAVLAFLLARRHNSTFATFFWLTWPLHLFLCTLAIAKSELVTAMLLPALGAYLGHHNRRRFAISFVMIVLVFIISQPWVHYGRGQIFSQTYTISRADYAERTELLARYIAGERVGSTRGDGVQGWWTRLNFSQVQAYAMNAYDNGRPGATLKNAWMLFVPRLLWPSKPIIEGPGKAFHALVTGGAGTSFLALSVYGDLYWQFGWLGVVLVCPMIGWFFAIMASRSLAIMRRRQFIMLPLVLIALSASLAGMNRYVFNGIIAVIPMYYAYLLGVVLLLSILTRTGKVRSSTVHTNTPRARS